ncbi:MAG: FAD-dependent monooxygenase [Nitrosomonadales bacterium]
MRTVDVIIVGASLSSAAAAKRLVDAGLETIVLERSQLPRHKICSGILSPRGHRFLLENFGPLPAEILHEPTSCRGVTFHFPSMVSMPMDFFGGSTPHLHRKFSDYWAIQRSGAEVHDQTSFTSLKDNGDHVIVTARKNGEPVEYRARQVIGADGPSSPVVRAVYPNIRSRFHGFLWDRSFMRSLTARWMNSIFISGFIQSWGTTLGATPATGGKLLAWASSAGIILPASTPTW